MAGKATEVAPSSSATRRDSTWQEARRSDRSSPSAYTGPTVWMTQRAGSRPAGVATARPVGRPSARGPARRRRQASRISGPPRRWMAPSTPPPPSSEPLAALTTASTATAVRSPSTTVMRGTPSSYHRHVLGERVDRVRRRMVEEGIDVLLVSLGADLPYLTGYEAMPLERLTMLVLPVGGDAILVVPRLEAPRVVEHPEVFALRPWEETEDPVAIVAGLAGTPAVAAVGDRTWARFLLELQRALPGTAWRWASEVTGPLRAVKGPDEVAALRRAAEGADRVAAALQAGEIPLVGRTESEVSAELGRRLVAAGHARVNFAIVASGPNAA